jgi:hypothetical protein
MAGLNDENVLLERRFAEHDLISGMSYRIIKICTPEIFVPYMDSGTVATLPE